LSRSFITPELVYRLLQKPIGPKKFDEDELQRIKNDLDAFCDAVDGIVAKAKSMNEINYYITAGLNIAIIIIGIVLMTYSLYEAIVVAGTPITLGITVATGGIAIASFATVFLTNPFARLRKTTADVIQVEIILDGWLNIILIAYYKLIADGFEDKPIEDFIAAIKDVTDKANTELEESIGSGN
jgi:hypothetical protein